MEIQKIFGVIQLMQIRNGKYVTLSNILTELSSAPMNLKTVLYAHKNHNVLCVSMDMREIHLLIKTGSPKMHVYSIFAHQTIEL